MSTIAIKERPILFNGPMVQAILSGQKTQTRRLVKPQPLDIGDDNWVIGEGSHNSSAEVIEHYEHNGGCHLGKPGDRLYVRETWGLWDTMPKDGPDGAQVFYRATDADLPACRHQRWHPSIHMPRWASRITLEITGVRVERLRNITEDDAIAEGFRKAHLHGELWATARSEFWDCWESIYGLGEKESNPWVWVVEFKQIKSTPV